MDFYKMPKCFENIDKINIISEKPSKQQTMKIKSPLPHRDTTWTLWMVVIFFKLIGLATLSTCIVSQKRKNRRLSYTFQYSELGIFYNAALISLMILSNFLSIPFRINMEYANKTNLTVGIEVLQTILGTVVICVVLFYYCINQKSLVKIVNGMMNVEHELDRLYRPPSQRQRIFRKLTIVCSLKGCLLVILLITEIFAFHVSPISWLTDVLPTFHVGWFMIQYFLVITAINADFVDVNRAIQGFSKISSPELQLQSFPHMRRVVISNSTLHQFLQLRDIHCYLCDISDNVSDFYSAPILFGITFMFLTLIYNSYYLLSPLLMTDEVLEYDLFINTVFWLVFLIYPLLLLTNSITKVLKEMGKTGCAVHNLLNCTIGSETASELKQFSLQLLHRKIEFTASGYFTLDNTLFHSIAGAVTTYLVILVQFQMGSSCSPKSYSNCTNT